MRKFVKKPIIVEAEQWFNGKQIQGVIDGSIFLNEGDWIIIGVEGERYVCKDSVFKKTYEEIME